MEQLPAESPTAPPTAFNNYKRQPGGDIEQSGAMHGYQPWHHRNGSRGSPEQGDMRGPLGTPRPGRDFQMSSPVGGTAHTRPQSFAGSDSGVDTNPPQPPQRINYGHAKPPANSKAADVNSWGASQGSSLVPTSGNGPEEVEDSGPEPLIQESSVPIFPDPVASPQIPVTIGSPAAAQSPTSPQKPLVPMSPKLPVKKPVPVNPYLNRNAGGHVQVLQSIMDDSDEETETAQEVGGVAGKQEQQRTQEEEATPMPTIGANRRSASTLNLATNSPPPAPVAGYVVVPESSPPSPAMGRTTRRYQIGSPATEPS
ncbi:hypothetical protein HDU93_009435 [Gonapodya sp. JEL0774]|nr:hypothetical protein HDU93_009435 [Gonapodya sp. JEL0774]